MVMEDAEGLPSNSLRDPLQDNDDSAPTPISDSEMSMSRKRSTPYQDEEEAAQEHPAKRTCVEETSLQSNLPEEAITAVVDTTLAFNDEAAQILRRAVTLVLEHVGFDGASKEALEEFCGEAESYMTRFLSKITESMLSSRRTQPTPLDFEYALKREGLTARLLRPHLKPPVSLFKICPLFNINSQERLDHKPITRLVSEELSGDSEKRSKLYIPKQFPSFPNKHTFRATEVKPERETDPRKIREKATEEAKLGEEALRRLVNVGKAADHKAVKDSSRTPTKQGIRHQLWEETMLELAVKKPRNGASFGRVDKEDLRSVLVNSDKRYGRKPVPRKKAITDS